MIHVVGLGGVGFWLTVGLVQHVRGEELVCWDDDTLTGTGRLRLPWGTENTKKVDLLKGYLAMVHGITALPQFNPRKFSGLIGVSTGDTVIDCTDMPLEPRKRMWNRAKKRGANILRVSYDGRGSIVLVSSGLPLSTPPDGGYTTMPSLALSLAAGGLGAETVWKYLQKPVEFLTVFLSVDNQVYATLDQGTNDV